MTQRQAISALERALSDIIEALRAANYRASEGGIDMVPLIHQAHALLDRLEQEIEADRWNLEGVLREGQQALRKSQAARRSLRQP